MKRTIIGIALLLSSTFMDLGFLYASVTMESEITSYNPDVGKMGTALIENNLGIPLILTNILLIFAIIILIKEYLHKI